MPIVVCPRQQEMQPGPVGESRLRPPTTSLYESSCDVLSATQSLHRPQIPVEEECCVHAPQCGPVLPRPPLGPPLCEVRAVAICFAIKFCPRFPPLLFDAGISPDITTIPPSVGIVPPYLLYSPGTPPASGSHSIGQVAAAPPYSPCVIAKR